MLRVCGARCKRASAWDGGHLGTGPNHDKGKSCHAELSVIPLTPSVNPHNESWLLNLDLNALRWRGNKSVVLQMTAALLSLSVLVAQALPGQGGMTAKEVIIVASALLSVIVVGVWVRWRGKKPK